MLTLFLSSLLTLSPSFLPLQLPLSGRPDSGTMRELRRIPGIFSVSLEENRMTIAVQDQARVPLSAIQAVLRTGRSEISVSVGQIPLNRNLLFQVDAGQCFNCFEIPMRKSFEHEDWVKSWSVIDYAPQGRFLFRIEPRLPALVEALEGVHWEEIWFSNRYDGVEQVNLDWPQAGIAWRPNEAQAVEESRRSQKPLLIFPTAGT